MKKHEQTSHQSQTMFQGLDDSPFVLWINEHGQKLFYIFAGGFLLLFILYFWFANGSSKAETDYYNSIKDFQAFQEAAENNSDPKAQKETFQKLHQIIQKRPDLHAKYDALIAQIFLNQSNYNDAKPFADNVFSRVSQDHLPYYMDYSKISLLIADNKYPEALKQSIAFKNELEKNAQENSDKKNFGSSLFAFNILRIAMLEQKVGTLAGEKKAWEDWKKYTKGSGTQNIDTKGFYAVENIFTTGNVSLNSYIEARLKQN